MVANKKVLVLMSGGVDSSTAAALLVRDGYEVAGVYLKLWDSGQKSMEALKHESIGDPCWAVEMKDAARVAAKLGIPFTVWDVTEDYKTRVLENFYAEYAAGRTPNPDVLCNSEIKFGVGLERAIAAGYEFIATGHYARVHNPPQPSLTLREGVSAQFPPLKACLPARQVRGGSPAERGKGELCQLYTAVDTNKDQSYFLWRLTQEQLSHTMFPIGEYTKPQVRELAKKFGLHNAEKKDSQGVCFLGKIDLKEFLYSCHPERSPKGEVEGSHAHACTHSPALPAGRCEIPRCAQNDIVRKEGPIVDVHGTLLGLHDGLAHFTIGQRHGTKLGGTGPYFVIEKDVAVNTLIVANEEEEPEYRAVSCEVSDFRCQVEIPTDGLKCMARVRYRAPLSKVVIARSRTTKQSHDQEIATPLLGVGARNDGESWQVIFDEPARAVAPGQSIVFYDGDRVLGGGIIDIVTLLCKVPKFANVS